MWLKRKPKNRRLGREQVLDVKLRSSLTLFALASEPESVFERLLGKYFGGKPDHRTVAMLGLQG